MKRLFDIFFSSIILIIFLPIGFFISALILLEGKGHIFYIQDRIGKGGNLFKLFKFRTMKIGSDKEGSLTVGSKESRITTIGFYLRKFKLDEFPQFVNVLQGNMSIVGPRPEVKEFVDLYTEDQKQILLVKPGITDYASLEYFNENEILGKSDNPRLTYINEIMPKKIELNKKYIDNPTFYHDLIIIWKTFLKIIN